MDTDTASAAASFTPASPKKPEGTPPGHQNSTATPPSSQLVYHYRSEDGRLCKRILKIRSFRIKRGALLDANLAFFSAANPDIALGSHAKDHTVTAKTALDKAEDELEDATGGWMTGLTFKHFAYPVPERAKRKRKQPVPETTIATTAAPPQPPSATEPSTDNATASNIPTTNVPRFMHLQRVADAVNNLCIGSAEELVATAHTALLADLVEPKKHVTLPEEKQKVAARYAALVQQHQAHIPSFTDASLVEEEEKKGHDPLVELLFPKVVWNNEQPPVIDSSSSSAAADTATGTFSSATANVTPAHPSEERVSKKGIRSIPACVLPLFIYRCPSWISLENTKEAYTEMGRCCEEAITSEHKRLNLPIACKKLQLAVLKCSMQCLFTFLNSSGQSAKIAKRNQKPPAQKTKPQSTPLAHPLEEAHSKQHEEEKQVTHATEEQLAPSKRKRFKKKVSLSRLSDIESDAQQTPPSAVAIFDSPSPAASTDNTSSAGEDDPHTPPPPRAVSPMGASAEGSAPTQKRLQKRKVQRVNYEGKTCNVTQVHCVYSTAKRRRVGKLIITAKAIENSVHAAVKEINEAEQWASAGDRARAMIVEVRTATQTPETK